MCTTDRKLTHRLLVARVGVTLAIVPGNGPQHQPRSLRAPSGCHTLSLTALPQGLASRPCPGHPSFCSSHTAQPRSHERVSGLVSPRGTGLGRRSQSTGGMWTPLGHPPWQDWDRAPLWEPRLLLGPRSPTSGTAAGPVRLARQPPMLGTNAPCVGASLPLSQVQKRMLREVQGVARGHRGRRGLRSYD